MAPSDNTEYIYKSTNLSERILEICEDGQGRWFNILCNKSDYSEVG